MSQILKPNRIGVNVLSFDMVWLGPVLLEPFIWDALFTWTMIAMEFFLYVVSRFAMAVTIKSYLEAPKMPAVGKLAHTITPWSSYDLADGSSEKDSWIQEAVAGNTVESASFDLPENKRKLDDRYSPTTLQARWWQSSGLARLGNQELNY